MLWLKVRIIKVCRGQAIPLQIPEFLKLRPVIYMWKNECRSDKQTTFIITHGGYIKLTSASKNVSEALQGNTYDACNLVYKKCSKNTCKGT